MELLFWIDALKRASAESVTAVIPYFSYAKGDKKDEPRVSIRARVCADAIEAAGVDRVSPWTCTRRSSRASSTCRSTTCTPCPRSATPIAAKAFPDLVVVAPDAGFAKRARALREAAGRALRDRRQGTHRPLRDRAHARPHRRRRREDRADRRRLHHHRRLTRRRRRGIVSDRGAAQIYAMVSHGLLTETASSGSPTARSSGCSSPTPSRPSPSRSPTRWR